MAQLTITDKLLGTVDLTQQQIQLAKKTYALLFLGIIAAIGGGAYGVQSKAVLSFFFETPSFAFLIAFISLNAIPYLALWASNQNPVIATVFLIIDGFWSGLVLTPSLFYARIKMACAGIKDPEFFIQCVSNPENANNQLLLAALIITLAVFVGITLYILFSKKQFVASTAVMGGLFLSLILAISLNIFLRLDIFSTLISLGVGIYGVLGLVYSTSTVLNDPEYKNPFYGALSLFASLFNIFVSVLRLLLYFSNSRR